jgi:hypothetical protein
MKDHGASTTRHALRHRTKEARGRLSGAKRTLFCIGSSCKTIVVYEPPVNRCTTLAIFVDHVANFDYSIRCHIIRVFHAEFKLVMRVVVFNFMFRVMPWISPDDTMELIRTLSIPVTKLHWLIGEVMMIDDV